MTSVKLFNLPNCLGLRRFLKILVGLMMIVASVPSLSAQYPESKSDQNSITGGPTNKELLPTVSSRPAASPLERMNLTQRPQNDQESISGLVKSVQDADSLIEVIVGRTRLITLQEPLATANAIETPVVAVGDPTVLEFDVLPNSQMIRILGHRVGNTDLSVVTSTGKVFTFEIRVAYDMNLLRAYLRQLFPNSSLTITQMYEHIVVEGEAASTDQSQQIVQAIRAFVTSAQTERSVKSSTGASPAVPFGLPVPPSAPGERETDPTTGQPFLPEAGIDPKPNVTATIAAPEIINLIRVPGVQQVMLQVKIAEVNRTALRNMGASVLYRDSSGRTLGSNRGSSQPFADDDGNILGLALGASSNAFAILPNTAMSLALDALRNNQVVTILAEPNLVTMHGQKASFLAGGQFPVPIPQNIGGGANVITVQYKDFGVLLDFVPYIMENGAIRLHVAPEVSTIDQTIGVSSGGISLPGLNTRRANTTVELRQGQSLALAGLLQVELDANTNRLPGIGDLPYLGPFFSNNSHERVEKELVIIVTPHFVEPFEADQLGPLPGCEIKDPDDHEFYLLNRIESRHTAVNYRATNGWDDPKRIRDAKTGNKPKRIAGPFGFSH